MTKLRYRFKSLRTPGSVLNFDDEITVRTFKAMLMNKYALTKCELHVYRNKKKLADHELIFSKENWKIPLNNTLIVKRMPLSRPVKKIRDHIPQHIFEQMSESERLQRVLKTSYRFRLPKKPKSQVNFYV